ncbi:MAG: archaeosortase/exosortase family protein [Lentisphaerae bacterium]|nr:archaeosortase/exosortase family protein [Lentisphaerota bacterium]
MTSTEDTPRPTPAPAPRWGLFLLCLAGLLVAFRDVLAQLAQLVRPSPLYSYIPLVPMVTLYLLHQRRRQLAVSSPAYGLAAGLAVLGVALLATGQRLPPATAQADQVAIGVAALLVLLFAAVALCFGAAMLRTGLCPWLILLFAIPLPDGLKNALELFLQQASAYAAYGMLALTPVPLYREGLVIHLPRLSLAVAPECSGINSTWVLLMCSLVAGTMLLRSPWRRAVLVAVVLPLGVLRNAFRIVTLGLLTVYVDPRIIDSPLHHRGGPLFFALSLVVLLAILIFLWRSERNDRRLGRGGTNQ